ncbi:MAG: hypothetical protein LUO98_08890 [Methanoregula sp.]|nr:hypothetical protein [Methanoregula sp.]
MGVLVLGIFNAGCTRSAGTGPVTTAVPESPPSPTETVTATTTTVPQPVVTIIRYISQTKDIKDTGLLFALQVPVEWNVSTYLLMRTDTPDYRTDLAADTAFSIHSYYFSQDKDKAYREQFRQWSPAPTETIVKINDITYDRFESASDGSTKVSYIMRGSSVNERGYASVLVFTARDSNRFEKEDFEKVVSSFRYFGRSSASTEPGEEIPLYDSSGNTVSRKASGGDSLAWGEWEGDSSGGDSSSGDSSGGDSSGGSSSDGGGCGCGG